MSEVEQRIARIRAGEQVQSDIQVFTDGARVSAEALALFREALESGSDAERRNLIHAIEAIGQRLDPLYERGSILLRDSGCVALIVDPGLAVMGLARDTALEVLLACVPPQLLHPFGPKLTAHLKAHTDDLSFRLIAKAKPPSARIEIARLMTMPRWALSESVKIAHAALGNSDTEQEFIDAFLMTGDANEKARLAKVLGYIGTSNTQKALAHEMRTGLVVVMPGVMRRSVRLDIITALRVSYPDKPVLWDQGIRDDSGYASVEDFCVQYFRVQWKTPRPPFLWIEGLQPGSATAR